MLFFYHFFYCFYCNEVVFWPLIHTAAHFHHNFMVHLRAYNSRPFALCAWVNNNILLRQLGGKEFITVYFCRYFLHGAKIRKNHFCASKIDGKRQKSGVKSPFCVQKRVEKAKKHGQKAPF